MDVVTDTVQRSRLDSGHETGHRVGSQEAPALVAPETPRGVYPVVVKPVIDRVGATILLILASPFMAGIGLIVLLALGRPIIFRQVRVGRNGRLFTVYKFCTMAADRRCGDVAIVGEDRRLTHKSENDPRLNPVGRVLRRWSLDELPQLWNVLRGDMSLVGPRPELPQIVDRFAPWQHQRHLVKPGLTGFWQVYARGDGLVMHEHTSLDIAYVRRMGLRTDLKILLLTIPAVVGLRKGF